MSDLKKLQDFILEFRDERNWKQFHNPKDCAISLSLEAAEFLEHFQWKTPEEIKSHLEKHKNDVADELVDVMYWVLLLAHDLDIDLVEHTKRKMEKNRKKYPVKKSHGTHNKYSNL